MNHQHKYGYGLFFIIHQKDGVVIDDCGLEHFEVTGTLELGLGYDLRSDYWGQGFATEAALAVRDFAFKELALSWLICFIRLTNIASCRVMSLVNTFSLKRNSSRVCDLNISPTHSLVLRGRHAYLLNLITMKFLCIV